MPNRAYTNTDNSADQNDSRLSSASIGDANLSVRNVHELAGGIEDWKDVQSQDVDRYGFITPRRGLTREGTPEPAAPNRTSTVSLVIVLMTQLLTLY